MVKTNYTDLIDLSLTGTSPAYANPYPPEKGKIVFSEIITVEKVEIKAVVWSFNNCGVKEMRVTERDGMVNIFHGYELVIGRKFRLEITTGSNWVQSKLLPENYKGWQYHAVKLYSQVRKWLISTWRSYRVFQEGKTYP